MITYLDTSAAIRLLVEEPPLRLGVDQVLTYDRELAAAARQADLTVLQPGAA